MNARPTPTRESAHEEALQTAIRASLAPAVASSHAPVASNSERQRGLLSRIFRDAEDRRHDQAQKVIRNVTEESLLATSGISMIANGVVASGLETEATFQATILEHRDNEMAMSAAPAYVQLARGAFSAGVSGVLQASIDHIRRRISDR